MKRIQWRGKGLKEWWKVGLSRRTYLIWNQYEIVLLAFANSAVSSTHQLILSLPSRTLLDEFLHSQFMGRGNARLHGGMRICRLRSLFGLVIFRAFMHSEIRCSRLLIVIDHRASWCLLWIPWPFIAVACIEQDALHVKEICSRTMAWWASSGVWLLGSRKFAGGRGLVLSNQQNWFRLVQRGSNDSSVGIQVSGHVPLIT